MALDKRKEYLDQQLKAIMQKSAKTEAENEREQLLVEQSVFLTEELEYVMVPAPGSGVPGKYIKVQRAEETFVRQLKYN